MLPFVAGSTCMFPTSNYLSTVKRWMGVSQQGHVFEAPPWDRLSLNNVFIACYLHFVLDVELELLCSSKSGL